MFDGLQGAEVEIDEGGVRTTGRKKYGKIING
jgi:hypothetical protein